MTALKVQQLQRLVVGGELPDTITGRTQPLHSQFLTGDQNIISMRVVVQYSVGVPADYLFRTQDVSRSVGAAVETAIAPSAVAGRNVDAVLTTEKLTVQDEVRAEAQRILNDYRRGRAALDREHRKRRRRPKPPTPFATWPARAPIPRAS